MNQANPNSGGSAAIFAGLCTTHTIKPPGHSNVFSMLSRISFYVLVRAAETELASSPASVTYGIHAPDLHRPAHRIYNSEFPWDASWVAP